MTKVSDAFRSEADEYRQGAPRPLGGYAAVMTVFAGLVGAAGAVAALRGTSGRRISPYDLMLMTAGTHKLARLVSKDAVTSPLRVPFTRYRERRPGRGHGGRPREGSAPACDRRTGELSVLPLGLVATGFSVGFLFAPRFTRVVASSLTAVAGSDYLQLIYAYLQQAAEKDQ